MLSRTSGYQTKSEIPILFIIVCLLGLSACSKQSPDPVNDAPTEADIRAWFTKYDVDWCQSHGYVEPVTTFGPIQIAPTTTYNFVGVGVKPCYPVKLEWTSVYADAYRKQRYTSRITDDFFRFYRDEFGELTIGDHVPGQSTFTTKAY